MKDKFFPRATGIAAVVALLAACSAYGQTVTGSITGTVTDPTGAVIPNASVTAVNTQTGVRNAAMSNGAGVYSLRFLPIGQYRIEVTAKGFSELTVPPFALEINQTADENAHLTVGATTTVKVTGNLAPILDTSNGTLGLSMSADAIKNLPLNGRNFSSITQFQPGAVDTDPTGLTSNNAIQRDTYNSGVVTINGNRAQDNNYTLDGIDINETQNNLIGYAPAPDALAEVRVISANAPATYGNVNGGDVVSVLKSGTNHFHGSAYEYLENQNLTANTWSNNFSGVGQAPFTQSTFGGTLGGPIVRNKLFFFIDYEGTRQHAGGSGSASVLSAAERQGDFSALLAKTGQQLVDPQNGYAPYAGNRGIPISNPVVQYLIAHPQYYPLPNHTATDNLDQNNLLEPTSSFVTNDQGDVKIEWNPEQRDKITAFYSQGISTGGSIAALPITFPNANSYPDHLGGATWTHIISPSIVNDVRFGFTRIRWDSNIPSDSTGAFGTNGDAVVGIPTPAPQQFAGFTYQGVGSEVTGVGVPGQAQVLRDNTYSLDEILSIQHGRQLFTLGGQLMRYQQNFAQYGTGGALGTYSFTGQNTALPGASNLYGPADWLLDRASEQSLSLSNGFFGERQWRVAGFLQDDWKATNRLTLNLGVRYDYDSPFVEVHNRIANVFLTGPQQGTVEYAGSVPAGAPAGSVVCPNNGCYSQTYDQVQPRFGFAFQATPRWVFRGGYGITSFLEGTSGLAANAPFIAFTDVNATAPSTLTNPGTYLAETNGFQVGAGSQGVAGYTAFNQVYRPAFLQEFNLNTELQLNNTTSVQVGYVGEIDQRLIDYRNGNQLTPAQAASLSALGLSSTTPLAQIPAADRAPLANLVGQSNKVEASDTEGVASYNALQVTMQHRVSKGFQATVNYTYAKSLTDTNGNYGASNSDGPNAIQNGYNIFGDYGPSELDTRHSLSANGYYNIPFGRGQMWGAHANRVLDLVAGGWTLSGTAIAYSGLPITITSPDNSNTNNYSNNSSRANQYRKLHIVNRGIGRWFGTDPSATPCSATDNGTCAYGAEAVNTFGTAGVGTQRAPGFEQIDTSLFKDFHLVEGQSVGFRADAFNVFNLVSYGNPDSNVGDPNFGQITTSKNSPRTIQFSANYTF